MRTYIRDWRGWLRCAQLAAVRCWWPVHSWPVHPWPVAGWRQCVVSCALVACCRVRGSACGNCRGGLWPGAGQCGWGTSVQVSGLGCPLAPAPLQSWPAHWAVWEVLEFPQPRLMECHGGVVAAAQPNESLTMARVLSSACADLDIDDVQWRLERVQCVGPVVQ